MQKPLPLPQIEIIFNDFIIQNWLQIVRLWRLLRLQIICYYDVNLQVFIIGTLTVQSPNLLYFFFRLVVQLTDDDRPRDVGARARRHVLLGAAVHPRTQEGPGAEVTPGSLPSSIWVLDKLILGDLIRDFEFTSLKTKFKKKNQLNSNSKYLKTFCSFNYWYSRQC